MGNEPKHGTLRTFQGDLNRERHAMSVLFNNLREGSDRRVLDQSVESFLTKRTCGNGYGDDSVQPLFVV